MDTILAPTDFSPAANNAVNYAAELTKFFDAKLVLVNSFSMPPVNYETGFALDIVTSLQKASQEQLEALRKQVLQKNPFLKIECEAEMGVPYDVIQDAVKKYNA